MYIKNSKNGNFTEYEQAIQFLERGCQCGCSAKVPMQGFAELREAFQALFKPEQDIFCQCNTLEI